MSTEDTQPGIVTDPDYDHVVAYLREKINQLLVVMGTLPLRTEELDDETLISIDPLGILADSFSQILDNHKQTNNQLEIVNNEITAIIDAVGAAIIVVNNDLNIELYNEQSLNLFKSKNDDYTGKYLCDCLDQQDKSIPTEIFESIIKEGVAVRNNNIFFGNKYYDLIATPLKDINGNVIKSILMFFDNTERILTEDKLILASVVFESTAEGVVVTDGNKVIVAVNDSFLNITGYKKYELIGQVPSIFKSGIHSDEFYDELWKNLNSTGHWKGDIMDRRKDGQLFPARQTISVVKRNDGTISHYVFIMSDITLQKDSQDKLDFLAHHDPLTSLSNRVLFQERLGQAIKKARRNETRVAVIFVDLDRFKNVNDTLGHAIGDKLLVSVAERLSNHKRRTDTVARLGGDEFVFLLDEVSKPRDLAHFCEKLITTFKKPFVIDGYDLHLTLSIGICIFPGDGDDVDSLIKNADAAMYRVKEKGKNGYHFFTRELSEQVAAKLTLENNLRKAIETQQFELYYQPQFSLTENKLVSAEALIRWNHPELGMIMPDKFIPLAEETGIILQIGKWVINEASRQLSAWRTNGLGLDHISVNVSGIQIDRGNTVTQISTALKKHQLIGSDLEIEITESTIMNDLEQAIEILGQLKELGLSIAIDDFGTGYSSLGYLKKLPIDKIKIDRSFVQDIDSDKDDKALVLAVIAMAKNLQLDVIAEGVETKVQHDLLVAHECEYSQGYLYARPLPAAEFEVC